MALTDNQIRALIRDGHFVLDPYEPSLVSSSSIDLRINGFARALRPGTDELDLRSSTAEMATKFEDVFLTENGYVIPPRDILIVQTKEFMQIPDTCQGMIAQRSSLMRVGLHVSSSLVNPGYRGNLPCMISNLTNRPVRIYPDLPFCQLVLLPMTERPEKTYADREDAKYQEERQFKISRISDDTALWATLGPVIEEAGKRFIQDSESKGNI